MNHIKLYTKFLSIIIIISIIPTNLMAQNETEISWWNPENSDYPVIIGQGWAPSEYESLFSRLPIIAKENVSEPVWNLSKQAAGLSIRFRTNSDNIHVKYKLKGELSMPHMPATGVSGLDLYKKTKDGNWERLWGNYKLDSISNYSFKNYDSSKFYDELGAEYQLFLPLYNEVTELSVGVDSGKQFKALRKRKEKPVVVYGTSIAQGACATRPGMAWTNILSRRIDREIINLGFSGNGKMETALGKLMTDIDAKAFFIDCLPNLSLKENPFIRTLNLVNILKDKHPNTPVILVAHPGYANNTAIESKLNIDVQKAITLLKSLGNERIYYLTKEELKLDFESFVDNIHPNDIGMTRYADAAENMYRVQFREFKGKESTTQPSTQYRDVANYNWEERHESIIDLNKTNPPKICLLGGSSVHFWGGESEVSSAINISNLDSIPKNTTIRNFGFGSDSVENVLWRIHHGEFDGFKAEKIILMLGSGNILTNTETAIIDGIGRIIEALKYRQPTSSLLLLGTLPRSKHEGRVSQLNMKLGMFALSNNIEFNHIGNVLLNENHKVNHDLYVDGIQPNNLGYKLLSNELYKVLNKVNTEDEIIEKKK